MFKATLTAWGPKPREIEITSDDLPLVFGRSPQAGVRVLDRWTSRRHCELTLTGDVLWLEDLGSTHGTLVNGRATLRAALAAGDTLQVGLSTFQVNYQGAEQHRTPPAAPIDVLGDSDRQNAAPGEAQAVVGASSCG